MTKELKVKYNLDIVFKYVPTDQNPADLLTRGLSLIKFKDLLHFGHTVQNGLKQLTVIGL